MKLQLLEANGLETLGLVDSDVSLPRPQGRHIFTYLGALGEGAVDEDSDRDVFTRHRMFNHFYNPTRNGRGLSDPGIFRYLFNGFSAFKPEEIHLPFAGSLAWAWDNLGAVATVRGDERYGWVQARDHYLRWLKHPDPSERSWQAGETFYALGHVIHLVQDLAQPQHTRNDAHAPSYWGLSGGDTAPFEIYCDKYFTTVAQITNLPLAKVPVFKKLPVAGANGAVPPEFKAFWNTQQPNPASGYVGDLGLAEFSNAFFVTDDTMFTGEPQRFIFQGKAFEIRSTQKIELYHIFEYPRLDELEGLTDPFPVATGGYVLRRLGEDVPPDLIWEHKMLSRRSPSIPNLCSYAFVPEQPGSFPPDAALQVGINDSNRKAHAQVLLPKAIAYSTGLLNYFFRGRLKMEFIYPAEGTSTANPQIKITNLTTNDSTGYGEALGSGLFTLLREDPITTNRSVVMSLPVYGNYPGLSTTNLPFEHSFTNNIGENLDRSGKLILVFQGTIGNEKDIGIAAVVSPGLCGNFEILANEGTNTVVNVGDLITFQRNRLNTDGTRTPVPITVDSWGGANDNWLGTPIDGLSETGHHPSYAFMNWGDGRLVAQRRGIWTSDPLAAGVSPLR